MCVLKLKVNWLEDILGSEWEITPAGGATGEAYFAKFQDRKLFLKRNSSPFLAVLSAEGIVPKLVWTRRMENGDVITAQHWLDGRELKRVIRYVEKVGENTASSRRRASRYCRECGRATSKRKYCRAGNQLFTSRASVRSDR